jgi:hypothetical protein
MSRGKTPNYPASRRRGWDKDCNDAPGSSISAEPLAAVDAKIRLAATGTIQDAAESPLSNTFAKALD